MTAKTISERIDAITGIPTDYRSVAPPCPRSVKIELTARCDLSCWFCATGFKLRDKRDMDRDFYDALLDDLKSSGVEEVGMFYLGESMLLPWLPDAIAAARAKGFPYIFLDHQRQPGEAREGSAPAWLPASTPSSFRSTGPTPNR